MQPSMPHNFFDKARVFAASGVLLAGLCAVAGSALDWVVIKERQVAEDADFGPETGEIEPGQGTAFRGIEDRDGWITLGGGGALVAAAVLLVLRRRSGYAWIAFWVSLLIGGIAFADYRNISDLEDAPTGIERRQEVGAEARPAIGLTVVTAAGMLGVISAVGGVAATPRPDEGA